VRLSSTAPANVSVPAIVTIPAGADRSSFPVTLLENVTVDGTLRVSVQAESSGYIGGRGELLVLDNESVSLRVSLPPRAREGAGRLSRQGCVRASHRTSRPVQVQLISSAPERLEVPATVILPAGETSVFFDLVVTDNDRIDGNSTVSVTAHVDNWTSGSDNLVLLEDDVPALSVLLPASVGENNSVRSKAASVRLSGRVSSNVVVHLQSSVPTKLQVPAAVEVKAGTRDVFFDLMPVDNLLINGRQQVSITAQAFAFGANSSELEVEDDETPPVPQQPIPSNGATNVAIPLRLAWNPGVGNILANGDFETGELTGWSQLNTGFGGWSINDGKLDPDGPDEVSAPWRGKFSALLAAVISCTRTSSCRWMRWAQLSRGTIASGITPLISHPIRPSEWRFVTPTTLC